MSCTRSRPNSSSQNKHLPSFLWKFCLGKEWIRPLELWTHSCQHFPSFFFPSFFLISSHFYCMCFFNVTCYSYGSAFWRSSSLFLYAAIVVRPHIQHRRVCVCVCASKEAPLVLKTNSIAAWFIVQLNKWKETRLVAFCCCRSGRPNPPWVPVSVCVTDSVPTCHACWKRLEGGERWQRHPPGPSPNLPIRPLVAWRTNDDFFKSLLNRLLSNWPSFSFHLKSFRNRGKIEHRRRKRGQKKNGNDSYRIKHSDVIVIQPLPNVVDPKI